MIYNLLNKIYSDFPENERVLLKSAFEFARKELYGKERGDGSEFISHAISVAEIVAGELGLMPGAVTAVFLHEATRGNSQMLEPLKREFGNEIILMAESLNRISEIKPKDTGLQADNYRKLIVSYSRDPRVTLIKLADRLEIMRNLDNFTKTQQVKKATETLLLYAPLAHQLGLYNMKSEMEDLSFRYTDPEHYRMITNKLKATEKDRENLMHQFVNPLDEKLKSSGLKYELKSRTKTAYSIWKKMQAQQISFESIADVFAMRFIIDCELEKEKELCWQVYSLVTERYVPDTKRLRDWITVPKPNGYESLHTTVSNDDGAVIEVQIRTRRMDEIAESGHAAHWSYKGVKREQGLDAWLGGVKKLLESPEKKGDSHIMNFSLDEIFVFTPDGDLRRLQAGACVLDFAFDIHTNLGLKCAGAKINGKPASIRDRLNTGDVVEIMSNKNQKPSQDWLNFVVSSKARAKIKQKIKEEESKRAVIGKELLERRMNNWKIEFNDDILYALIKQYKFKTASEFYSALAMSEVDIVDVRNFLNSKSAQDTSDSKESAVITTDRREVRSSSSDSDYLIIDERLNNVGFKLSKCCNPIHGDDVIGFVSVKDGIKIHRTSCPNASRLIENYPYRIHKVKWRENISGTNFITAIRVSAHEEGVINQKVLEVIGQFNVSLRFFSLNKLKDVFEARMQLAVPNNQLLDKLIFSLKKVKGIKSVSRVSNV
ncbi:MAG: RelA/SpoT family protein [Bacteroidales bacterium]